MKKSLIITLIAAGVVTVAATVMIAGFSGLPAKKRAVTQYGEALDFVPKEYPYANLEVPADYVTCTQQGISLMMPADLMQLDSDPDSFRSGVFMNEDKSVLVMFEKPYEFGEMDLATIDEQASAEAMDRFCRSLGREPIKTWYEFVDMIFHLKPDDCNIHSMKQAAVFEALSYTKSEVLPVCNELWDWENADGDKGFIMRMDQASEDEADSSRYSIQAELYDPDTGNTSYAVLIKAQDSETCFRIANSIRLDK